MCDAQFKGLRALWAASMFDLDWILESIVPRVTVPAASRSRAQDRDARRHLNASDPISAIPAVKATT
jgi:hypothetical protein